MMKTKKLIFFFAASLAFAPMHAQDDDKDNLVPNSSFEKFEGTLRRDEMFDLTLQWTNPTESVADLFATNIRSKYVMVPENMFGYEEAYEGENYAGIMTYTFRNKRKRNYIMTQLDTKMRKGNIYCIRFRASLAERSLYAANNMGVVLSKGKLKGGSGSIENSGALLSNMNPIVKQTEGWWEFCAKYAATGDETYLTIGNFSSDNSTQTKTRQLDSKYSEVGPVKAAYYYIDMVEVIRVPANETCNCEDTKIPDSKVIYSSSVQLNDDMTITQKVDAIDAYFYQYQSKLSSAAKKSIDQIAEMMVANPMMKIEVMGHMDNGEIAFAKKEPSIQNLDVDRAKAVREYMSSKGVDRSKILTAGHKNTKPVSKMTTPISLAKNRRVEFRLVL